MVFLKLVHTECQVNNKTQQFWMKVVSLVPNAQTVFDFFCDLTFFDSQNHTAGSDTTFVQIYMDPPPEVPGVSKDAPGSTKHAI